MSDKSLKIGFALEGNSDYKVIPILVERYLAEKYPELQVSVETLRPNQRGAWVREKAARICDVALRKRGKRHRRCG